MKQWEYKRVYFDDVEKEAEEVSAPGSDGFSTILNAHGMNGWELCQTTSLDDVGNSYFYIFKREKKYAMPIDRFE